MNNSNVVEIPRVTLADIPKVLRSIADEIEAGAYGDCQMAIVVLECGDGDIENFGAGGGVDSYRAHGLLNMGIAKLNKQRFGD